MNPRLACADFTFPLLEHDKVLALIGLLDFQGVDIGLFENRGHLQPSTELADPDRRGEALGRRAAGAGLKIADVFLQTSTDFREYAINHPDRARRDHNRELFLKTLDYASAAGSDHITCLPGVRFDDEPKSAWLGRAATELAWRIDQANRYHLRFSTEVHIGSLASTPAEAIELLENVPGLKLTLDYTHFVRAGQDARAADVLIPYADHFHVRGAAPGKLQTIFQQNVIDYPAIVSLLNQAHYQGWIGIEYIWTEWENANQCDNISETIQFRDVIRRAWGGI
jgi:sugar phosphate isomerase/epimerase